MNQTVTQYQCTCEQSFCVFMWKPGPGLIASWAAGRAYRDSEVHLSPINLCLFLCVSVDAGDELWTESRLAHMLSAEPWNECLRKVSFFSFSVIYAGWLLLSTVSAAHCSVKLSVTQAVVYFMSRCLLLNAELLTVKMYIVSYCCLTLCCW